MTYTYRCKKCGPLEVDHKFGDVRRICPRCGSSMKRTYKHAPGVIFKGEPGASGFHAIDYASDEDKKKRMEDYGKKLDKQID